MITLNISDTIVDLIVSELQTAIEDDSGYSLPFTVEARDKPDFDLIDAVDNTTIYVSSAPTIGRNRASRGTVAKDVNIAIGVLKKLTCDAAAGGIPDPEEFRELKSLVDWIADWCEAGVTGYRKQVLNVSLPAWFDLQKSQSPGAFLSIVTMTYKTKASA